MGSGCLSYILSMLCGVYTIEEIVGVIICGFHEKQNKAFTGYVVGTSLLLTTLGFGIPNMAQHFLIIETVTYVLLAFPKKRCHLFYGIPSFVIG